MHPTIQLLKFLLLVDFPSGSSINYHDNKLYLIGDDATHISILDTDYRKIDSIKLFDNSERRIPKFRKADLEASTLVDVNGKALVLAVGSASREERKRVMLIDITSSCQQQHHFPEYDDREFINRIMMKGIEEVNIEGVTVIGDNIILSNRGNQSNPKNHLIITANYFWERQKETPIDVYQLLLPANNNEFTGVSEIQYSKTNDILFLSFSSESTSNSYDDGAIGDSQIGWIKNASQRINNHEWRLDGLIPLADIDQEFTKQKIEGLCVESVQDNTYILHLISDNDLGQSKLFKIKMELESND